MILPAFPDLVLPTLPCRRPFSGSVLTLVVLAPLLLAVRPASASCGFSGTSAEPLGGGLGYGRAVSSVGAIVLPSNADLSDLTSALAAATSGQTVFIPGDAEIDFGSQRNIVIPGGVTLASDRGLNGSSGALLYTNDFGGTMLLSGGSNVRLTGVRLRGPSQTQAQVGSTSGIRGEHDQFEVDNCELYGFPAAAIGFRNESDPCTFNANVAYNNIHHNQMAGWGYGVVLGRSGNVMVEIHGNVFNANRHSVAGSGAAGQSYIAHDNLALWTGNGHVFDMHADCEPSEPVYGSAVAGGWLEVRNNYVLVPNQRAVTWRSSPSIGTSIVDNYFSNSSEPIKVYQHVNSRTWPDGPGQGNRYCKEVENEPIKNYDTNSPSYNCYDFSRWLVGLGATDHWQLLTSSSYEVGDLGFGDFNGDSITDVFRTAGGEWYVSWGGNSSWDSINSSSVTIGSLRFADFDGDGETDVFQRSGSDWKVAWSGTGNWQTIGSSGVSLADLRFADFNGDGRADIFRRSGNTWKVAFAKPSRQGTTSWRTVASFAGTGGASAGGSGGSIDNLRFGDFDGDGATDVFSTDGGDWYVAHGDDGCNINSSTSCQFGAWQDVNTSSISLNALAFADVDGDGRTDVLRVASDNRFQAAYGASGGWKQRGEAPPFALDEMAFFDFNGDGADDVFVSHQDTP